MAEFGIIFYTAIIHKDEDSGYGVSFPDVPGCFSAGETLDEALQMGAEALALHFEESEPPSPRPFLDVESEQILAYFAPYANGVYDEPFAILPIPYVFAKDK